jgi:hypothetical protein
MLLDFKNPPYNVLEKVVSYSGKYLGFYGTHYHKGIFCYVVGAINKLNGEITARHYNEKQDGCVNQEHAAAASQKAWNEFFAGLVRKPSDEDLEADASKQVEQWFDTYERRINEGLRKRSPKVN